MDGKYKQLYLPKTIELRNHKQFIVFLIIS